MTIAEAITAVDRLKPNQYSTEQKVYWLWQLEEQIFQEIVNTHENPMMIKRPVINQDTDPDMKLIAPSPYDEVYQLYIMCQIDLGNMEIGKYNNDRTLYNNALMTLRDYWNRTFMPCEKAPCFIFDDRRRRPPEPYDGHPIYSKGNPLDIEPVHGKRKKAPVMKEPFMKPVPMKSVQEEIVQIHATDRAQQKQIDELISAAGSPDVSPITSQEVGEIIGS